MSEAPDLERLIARYLDGQASATEVATLDALVCRDPVAAQALGRASRLEADLRRVHRAQVSGRTVTVRLGKAQRRARARSARRPRVGRRAWTWQPALAVAALLLVGFGVWWMVPSSFAPFRQGTLVVAPGQTLAGTVAVAGGGSISLSAGAVATAEGTTRDPVLRLTSGEARCQVDHRAPGQTFTVRTPTGQVQVVGTTFTVRSTDEGLVQVEEGRVLVTAQGRQVPVPAGWTGWWDAAAGPVAFGPVAVVSDVPLWNLTGPSARIVPDGLAPTGDPAWRCTLSATRAWVSSLWVDRSRNWSQERGISILLRGAGTGRRFHLELFDNGDPHISAVESDHTERFWIELVDDVPGWSERRIPFTSLVRRPDLWPGIPQDGLTLTEVHGFALIASQEPLELHIARIGTWR